MDVGKAADEEITFAFFVLDVDHKWRHEITCSDKEIGIELVEKFKHDRGCLGMVALRIPDGHKIYEWNL
jgi:hypothetical protein